MILEISSMYICLNFRVAPLSHPVWTFVLNHPPYMKAEICINHLERGC